MQRPGMPAQRLLTFTFGGRGLYRCEGIELEVRRGDMVVMHDDSPTAHGAPSGGEPWDFLFVMFNPPRRLLLPPVFDRIAPGLHRAHVAQESTRQRVQDAFAHMLAELGRRDTARALNELTNSPAPFAEPTEEPERRLLLTFIEVILLLAIRDHSNRITFDPRITAALEAMGTDPVGPHTVSSLAKMVNTSPSRFAHLFTAQVGLSPMRTLRLIRLQHAARLLHSTSQPISTIATASGFSSISDFSTQFRRHHGMSPSAYRTQWQS